MAALAIIAVHMSTLSDFVVVEAGNFPALLRDWREDTVTFLHHDMPKLVVIQAPSS